MKKKLAALVLAAALIVPLTGCNERDIRIQQTGNHVLVYSYNGLYPQSVVQEETPEGYTVTITITKQK